MTCAVQTLKTTPREMRKRILEMAYKGKSGHIGCAFSVVEIVNSLYSKCIRLNPNNLKDKSRDYFVLSKGHGVMALYVCLEDLGVIESKHLDNYFTDGSDLHGLAEYGIPGIEASGGSLGHGICVATGMAYGLKIDGTDQRVYCLVGDGEINEGSFWESVLFSSHHKLNNLTIIIDVNKFQAMGKTKDIIDLGDLAEKFKSFGFYTIECDGHDLEKLEEVFNDGLKSQQPKVIIANTVKGKGVKDFENENNWHYYKMTPEIYTKAMSEIEL